MASAQFLATKSRLVVSERYLHVFSDEVLT